MRGFLNKLDNLKFLCYIGADGYPVLIPAIQTQRMDDQMDGICVGGHE